MTLVLWRFAAKASSYSPRSSPTAQPPRPVQAHAHERMTAALNRPANPAHHAAYRTHTHTHTHAPARPRRRSGERCARPPRLQAVSVDGSVRYFESPVRAGVENAPHPKHSAALDSRSLELSFGVCAGAQPSAAQLAERRPTAHFDWRVFCGASPARYSERSTARYTGCARRCAAKASTSCSCGAG